MGNPNCCFMIIAVAFFSPANRRGELWMVSKSRKQSMVSSFLLKNGRWDNFMSWKLSQRSFFGRIEDPIICFRDCLTFNGKKDCDFVYLFILNVWGRKRKCHLRFTYLYPKRLPVSNCIQECNSLNDFWLRKSTYYLALNLYN